MIPVAIGIGLIMSLIFSEAFGLAAGGMVVPGYIALALAEPWRVVGTVVAAVLTYLTAKIMGQFMLLYGKRFLVMVILLGFLYGHLTRVIFGRPEFPEFLSFEAIGYIIPGLIAYWMDRQGAFVTLMSMLMAAVMVRLVLILTTGGAPIEVPTW
ncbi:MAG: poly-gamma-glutamate biosynthesis protein PgsC [Candidatus Eisenbacteria bacterium]|nr:poly-gamma-glutamate biosynthesis protein PgsC [Candidatus Eisenbacteria bacterium]